MARFPRLLAAAAAVLLCVPRAPAQDLDALLAKTSRQVAAYLDRVSDVKCTEQVTQLKLGPQGRVEAREQSSFDYFILLQGGGDDLLLNESRLPVHDARPAKNVPLLISNGFSTLFLIFHPYYRGSFAFSLLQGEAAEGAPRLVRVGFVHRKGMRTPAALAVRGREYPLELAGTAWIDPDDGAIVRLQATLAADMSDVGLRDLHADVEYAPVRLPGWAGESRFPAVATVDVESLRQHWRNIHRFTDYSRFVVDTEEKVSPAKADKQ